ncbi:MAG: sigma-54 dependent transcriptional regulator, partial [SAR324 cluster bacterium]|nr:sigma-54 dependent transcriptional regulator [SAR324 cluster bacterium]
LKVVRTQSPRMRQVLEKLKSVAPTRTTVLLLGDTGGGKGMIAKLIHQHSSRSDMHFVHLHCAAIPETLVESELFGYEKGAFTGANKRKLGRFDKAQGGMLFLDEVNTISPSTQIKLLQVLQERIFQRVGGEQPIEADVRIITASNSDLSALCEEGSFRRDLYYRLSVFPIQLPSLRERTEDIPQIIDSLIEWFNQHYFKDIQGIDPFVIKALKQYDWPGNVRELENIIERAYILEQTRVLSAENFPQEILVQDGHTDEFLLDAKLPLAEVRRQSLEQVERQYLKELLMMHQGRVNRAAETAGITTRQLHKLLTKYSIRKEAFKPPKVNKNQPSGEAL